MAKKSITQEVGEENTVEQVEEVVLPDYYLVFDENNILAARYQTDIQPIVPEGAVKVEESVYRQTIDETDGVWTNTTNGIKKLPITQDAKENTLNKILDLEKLVTARRLREAVLGNDNGWLANIDAQISELRNGLNG